MYRSPNRVVLVCSALLALVTAACSPKIPEGRFACTTTADCPPNHTCEQSLCYSPGALPDAGTVCSTNVDCDDGVFCDGVELCVPQSLNADARGCIGGDPACSASFICTEGTQSCDINCANPDPDGDGHNSAACGGDDCDDLDADRFPGNPETCLDGHGGAHDEDCNPLTFGSLDADGDGEVSNVCCNDNAGTPTCGTDCDDTDRSRRSGQIEFCDLIDNDCDGTSDNGTAVVDWYPDGDGDGFGGMGTMMSSCAPISGYSLFNTDCDDTDPARSPAQVEVCDLVENNCNGLTDEQPYCGTTVAVGPGGGTLATAASGGGSINLVVPPGALSSPTPVSIGEYPPRTLPALAAGQEFVGFPVAVMPFDVTFPLPVTLTLPATGSGLVILALDGPDDLSWEELSASFDGSFAVVDLSHGGIYAVATQVCSAGTWDNDGFAVTGCVAWTDCVPGEFVESGGSAASDRVCATCSPNGYSTTANATACVPHTTCLPGTFAVGTATSTQTRTCEACVGETFTDVDNAPECALWSTCASGAVEVAAGSPTSDRVCQSLSWTRQFGTTGSDSGGDVAVTSSGEVYVLGRAPTQLPGTPTFSSQLFVRKYSRTGVEIWSRHLPASLGDYSNGVHIGPSDSLYVLTSDTTNSRVSRLDSNGNLVSTTPDIPVYVNSFTVDSSGNSYVVGAFSGWSVGSTGQDGKLLKYGPDGALILGPLHLTTAVNYNTAADTAACEEVIQAIVADSSGFVYVAGYSGSPFAGSTGSGRSFVQQRSAANGSLIWTRHYGSNTPYDLDVASMAVSPDGGTIYVAGRTSAQLPGQTALGGEDAFVHAFTSSGAASWIRQISTSGDEFGEGLVVLSGGDVVVVGTTTGVLDPLATFGGTDVFIQRMQGGSGALVGRIVFGSASNDTVSRSMASHTDGYIVLGGATGGTLPFDGQQRVGSVDVFARRLLPP